MRTTLSIDDDILDAARSIADREDRSIGDVVSDLARRGLRPVSPAVRLRNGVPLLPRREDGGPVSTDLVNRLRDELP